MVKMVDTEVSKTFIFIYRYVGSNPTRSIFIFKRDIEKGYLFGLMTQSCQFESDSRY